MATAPVLAPQPALPLLKLTGLHIENAGVLRRVQWPEDGLGWGKEVPSVVLVGGVNGSGKTTLLELIGEVLGYFGGADVTSRLVKALPNNVRIKLSFVLRTMVASPPQSFAILIGDERFLAREATAGDIAFLAGRQTEIPRIPRSLFDFLTVVRDPKQFVATTIPSVIYVPASRSTKMPRTDAKTVGKFSNQATFYSRLSQPEAWHASIEAALYAARWEDLNAKDEGRPQDAIHFASFATAYEAFFEGAKRIKWRQGELVVEITDTGALHELNDLSSGERQIVVLAGELLRRWRPGSLILIDEPELHLHEAWQTKLWGMLTQWQREHGGQVIATTQSGHLFHISEPGTRVLLGGWDAS